LILKIAKLLKIEKNFCFFAAIHIFVSLKTFNMKNSIYLCVIYIGLITNGCQNNTPSKRAAYSIALHGGAGTILKKNMTPEKEAAYLKALNEALSIGETILKSGGKATDAVEKTIIYLEDCPLFNAGKGSVFTFDGKNEMDASFMDGSNQKAGAVCGVMNLKNPIRAARAVLEKSPHVFLSGRGAEVFAQSVGIDTASPPYFFTQERWDGLQKVKLEEKTKGNSGDVSFGKTDYKFGTVGVACLDQSGNLAAGTSTGGMTNKRWNRVGDAPVIGAGTYADNATAAVSCTGHGEYFIRYTVARDICAMMEYKGSSLAAAGEQIVMKKLVEKGGEGGLIAVDKLGNIIMPFNSEGMYRACVKAGEERKVLIYK
jgi:beta-aspartyl-peptidase (threonine type)